jgi:hypothetical protein
VDNQELCTTYLATDSNLGARTSGTREPSARSAGGSTTSTILSRGLPPRSSRTARRLSPSTSATAKRRLGASPSTARCGTRTLTTNDKLRALRFWRRALAEGAAAADSMAAPHRCPACLATGQATYLHDGCTLTISMALRSMALRSMALRSMALRSMALRSMALRSMALRLARYPHHGFLLRQMGM